MLIFSSVCEFPHTIDQMILWEDFKIFGSSSEFPEPNKRAHQTAHSRLPRRGPPRIPALFRPDLFGGSFLGESRKQSQYSVPFSSRNHRSYTEIDKLTAA